jgi:hypothetical protein
MFLELLNLVPLVKLGVFSMASTTFKDARFNYIKFVSMGKTHLLRESKRFTVFIVYATKKQSFTKLDVY